MFCLNGGTLPLASSFGEATADGVELRKTQSLQRAKGAKIIEQRERFG